MTEEIDFEKVMDDAIEKVQQGWCQYDSKIFSRHGVKYCFIGAMIHSFPVDLSVAHHPDWKRLLDIAVNTLREETGHPSIPLFNDAEDRSKEDVLLMMKKVKENVHAQ